MQESKRRRSILQYGVGVSINYKESMAIDGRYSNTMYSYAEMLNHGIGVAVDYKEVIEYFKITISREVPIAMYEYAKKYSRC